MPNIKKPNHLGQNLPGSNMGNNPPSPRSNVSSQAGRQADMQRGNRMNQGRDMNMSGNDMGLGQQAQRQQGMGSEINTGRSTEMGRDARMQMGNDRGQNPSMNRDANRDMQRSGPQGRDRDMGRESDSGMDLTSDRDMEQNRDMDRGPMQDWAE